jgi:hypothetical protein
MCLPATIIDERLDRLMALLAACRSVTTANQELGRENFAGALVLIEEVERGLNEFANELKASSCQPKE